MTSANRVARAFSTDGRVGPLRILLVLIAAGLVWALAIAVLRYGETAAYLATGAVLGAMLAKVCAEVTRRFHDIGRSGGFAAAIAAGLAALIIVTTIVSTNLDGDWPVAIAGVFAAMVAALFLFRPGQRASNAFGTPPPAPFAHAPGADGAATARSLVAATASILGGALIAFAMISISHGMRDSRERNMEFVQQQEQGL